MDIEKKYFCHGGELLYCRHDSEETGTEMKFSLFLPPGKTEQTSYLVFLSGLTCTADNFTTKANAYAKAAETGLAILAPDTSPRGEGVADGEGYDIGQGAGFYLDAIQDPWSKNFRMESYILKELTPQVESHFSLASKRSITGHSMGGHGALTLFLKNKDYFSSCSAFAPIVAPTQIPWGQKAFEAYLGDNQETWKHYDSCELVKADDSASSNTEILIDQGLGDDFINDQLKPELFREACKESGQKLTLRLHEGYDHSYFFIQSFIDDHIEWHARHLS